MTIYGGSAPDWDKSGEKRVAMPPEMLAKYVGAIKVTYVAQAKDGRWCFAKTEASAKAKATGDYDTAPEAAKAAAVENDIIINVAPPAKAPVKKILLRRITPPKESLA